MNCRRVSTGASDGLSRRLLLAEEIEHQEICWTCVPDHGHLPRECMRNVTPNARKTQTAHPAWGRAASGPWYHPNSRRLASPRTFRTARVVGSAIRRLCNGSLLVVAHPRRCLLPGVHQGSERGSEVFFTGGPDPASQLPRFSAPLSPVTRPRRSLYGLLSSYATKPGGTCQPPGFVHFRALREAGNDRSSTFLTDTTPNAQDVRFFPLPPLTGFEDSASGKTSASRPSTSSSAEESGSIASSTIGAKPSVSDCSTMSRRKSRSDSRKALRRG